MLFAPASSPNATKLTDFRGEDIPAHARRTEQAHQLLWHADGRLASHRRNLPRRDRVLSIDGVESGGASREEVHIRSEQLLVSPWPARRTLVLIVVLPCDQLFDTASVVEYYESFAKHAFESTSSSVMTQCVVLGPSGRPVPCAFCFSVRRDLFSVGTLFLLAADVRARCWVDTDVLPTVPIPRYRFLPPRVGVSVCSQAAGGTDVLLRPSPRLACEISAVSAPIIWRKMPNFAR